MTDLSKISPPPLRKDQALFWTMATRNGEIFAAPLGTPLNFDFPEAWLRITSLDELRHMFGVTS